MSEPKHDLDWLREHTKPLPHTIWRDRRWGGVALTHAEWDRLKWWQQIRYNLFGILPKHFERDPV
jgi:hypothetical protein